MNDLSAYLMTRTGLRLHVRPARPADAPTVADFFTHVTRADLRYHFLTSMDPLGPDRIAALVEVDHRQTESFLAFTADGSMMIASGVLACNPARQHGKVAISVRNDFKHRGVSWELLSYIARHAEAQGLQTLESIESRENRAAIELERDMGLTIEPYPGDATLVLVSCDLSKTVAPMSWPHSAVRN